MTLTTNIMHLRYVGIYLSRIGFLEMHKLHIGIQYILDVINCISVLNLVRHMCSIVLWCVQIMSIDHFLILNLL